MHRKPSLLFGLCLGASALAGAAELLHFDFNDAAQLAAEPAPLPAAQILGPVTASGDFPGSADFHGGRLKRAAFHSPQGPFSIEARFRIRSFAPEQSRFVANLVNAATWDHGPSQGFAFKVGGAYLYPVLPRNAYRTEAEWLAAQAGYSHIDAGRMSVCFPTLSIARKDTAQIWKQVFADRCVEPNAWTHLVAVWDGHDMRLYMNGLEATDPWRITGAGAPPLLDSVTDLFVGARNDSAYDDVPFDGVIDYVKMEDSALSPAEIHARYQATFVPEKRDSLCWGVLLPVYPEAGQVCPGRLHVEVKVFNHGACTDPRFIAGFLSGDSVEIEVAKTPDFDTVAARVRFSSLSFDLDLADFSSLAHYQGPIYWRVRLIPAAREQALAKAAVVEPEWSPARPIVLDLTGTTGLARPAPRLVHVMKGSLWQGREAPALFDLSGKRAAARFSRLPGGEGSQTYWRLESLPAGAGVLLAR